MERGRRESLEAQQGFREVEKPEGFGELGKDTQRRCWSSGENGKGKKVEMKTILE